MLGLALVTDTLCGFGIKSARPLCFPVQGSSCIAHAIVDIPCVRDLLGNICCVSRDLGGDNSLFYIVNIRKSQVLSRCYVAKESCTACRCDCSTDCRCDMVIAGSNVGNDGTKHIEWCAHAYGLLHLHIGFDLIHRHMTGAFYHYLHVTLPSTPRKLTEANKLLYLTYVTSVRKATGTACVTERNRYVVLTADVKYLVVILVEGVLFPRHTHPSKYERAASRDDIHLSLMLSDLLNGLTGNAAMKRYKVNAVLCVKSYYIDKVLCSEGCKVALIVDNAIVYGNRTDHSGALTCELSTEGLGVSV